MSDINSSLPAGKRTVLAGLFKVGRSHEGHTYESCRLVWSDLPLLTAAFVLVLAICGCGSGFGTPISGALSLTPGSLQFGDVLVGVEANTSLNVANHGPEAVVLSQIKIAGQTFSVAGGGGLPVTIPSGGTHTLSVGFSPVSEGNYSGDLSLIDASAKVVGQATIYGRGAAGAPQLSLSAASVSFGNTAVNGTTQKTLTLKSIGTQPITVNSVATSVASFSVDGGSLPVTLNPGQSMNLTVRFQPAVAGIAKGQLSINSNSSTGATAMVALSGTGIAATNPQLSTSTSSLSFGKVTVGTSVQKPLTLRSTGTSPVTVNSVAISGAGFTIMGGSLPVTLNPGQSLTVSIQFKPTTPTAAAGASGRLSISSNSSAGATTVVALSGVGIAAAKQLGASTSSLSFGSVTVGTSVTQSLTLRSTGTSPVTVNSAAISGAAFAIAGGSFPVTLNPGQSMTVSIRFKPTTAAAASGQLSISSNSSGGATTVVALSGTGIAAPNPQLGASTSSLSFGSVTVGTSVTQSLTLRSTGTSPVTVNSAAISGAAFAIAGGSLPVTLNPGQSVTLMIQFKPTTAAAASGQLSINSNSSTGATTVVALSGTGTAAANPQLSASTSSLSFGSVTVGTSVTQSLTLRSTGTSPVTVNSAAISGAAFAIAGGSFPVTLNPGQSMTVSIQFKPTAAAAASGQLSINSNSSKGATTVVALSGTGTAATNPQLSASTSSLSFGSVTVGTSVTQSLALRSAGTSPVTVNSAAISGAAFTIAGGSFPVTLNPGQSVTLMIQFKPTTAATVSGQLSINSNSSKGAATVVALSGTGTAANPELTANATSVNFGSVAVNVATTSTLKLNSTGSTPVTVSSAQVQGNGFTIVGGSFPVTLNPGQALSLQLRFQPAAAGTATGKLTITSNSLGGASIVVSLSGIATAVAHEVDLSWLPPSSSPDPVVGYNIYRSVSGGGFVRLNSSVSPTTTYVDSTVASSVSYSYVAKSVDANGVESTASNEYQVTIP